MDRDDLQKHIDKIMHEQNNRPIPEFLGYSPFEMHHILHFTLEADSPVKMQELSDTDYKRIPILNQIKYLMGLLAENGEIKLTKKGYLPTKTVSDIYRQGYMKDEFIEKGYSKLYKETDSATINLTRILCELSGLTKKRKGTLSLTKLSQKMLEDNPKLLRRIFLTFATKFNWAYYDGYEDEQIGQLGYGFSLILLSKYGQKDRLDSFYAEKYFKAYPQLLQSAESDHELSEKYSKRCYSIRTFDRFLDYFGLIRIREEGSFLDSIKYITKTDLFDKLIDVQPHRIGNKK